VAPYPLPQTLTPNPLSLVWVRQGHRPCLTQTPYAGWVWGVGGGPGTSSPWPSPHNYHKSIPQKFFLDMGQGIF